MQAVNKLATRRGCPHRVCTADEAGAYKLPIRPNGNGDIVTTLMTQCKRGQSSALDPSAFM
jgi:hypothetical protein